MSILGLAPFTAYLSKPQSIRLYVPFLVYTLIIIVVMFDLAVRHIVEYVIENPISVPIIIQTMRFLIMGSMFTMSLLISVCWGSLHVQFLISLDTFHEAVCKIDSKNNQSSNYICRLVAESVVCNLLFCVPLCSLYLESLSFFDAIENCTMLFVGLAFMFHVVSMVRVMRYDLQIIRRNFACNQFSFYDDPAFALLDEYLKIKHYFESVFGRFLAFCAGFDFVNTVIALYMTTMYVTMITFTWYDFVRGLLGFVCPSIVKQVRLATACSGIASEVG